MTDEALAAHAAAQNGETVPVFLLEAAMLDREFVARNRRSFSYLIGRFMVEHLARVHRAFEGDLALALVLGTIGQYNSRRFFEEVVANSSESAESLVARGEHLSWLRPCNATSVSASTGIPRETVRRKIRWLMDRGFVQQVGRTKLFITPKAAEHFAEFDLEMIDRFRLLIEQVEALAARRRGAEKLAAAAIPGGVARTPR